MSFKRKTLSGISLAGALALLLGGFVLAGRWQMAPLLLAAALVGWAIGRLRPHWLPGACLLGYVTCAAGGVLLGVSPAMLIAGVALMLVSWELMDGREPDRARLTLLLASAGAGLLMAEAGLWVRLQLPFGGVLLAGGVALFGLYRFWRDARRA